MKKTALLPTLWDLQSNSPNSETHTLNITYNIICNVITHIINYGPSKRLFYIIIIITKTIFTPV
jgi:hypothetical protein